MDTTMDELIVNDQSTRYCFDKEETINVIHDLLPLSGDCKGLSLDTDYSPKRTNADEIYPTSDSSVQQQETTPISDKHDRYRIHLGTQPGYYKEGHITFTESRKLHSKVIDSLENFLTSVNADYEMIKKNGFSNSAWGLEPYACILVSCSDEIAQCLAAIIGLALRQDAIGIYTNNNDGYAHPVFTISTSDGSLLSETNALILMKTITKHCTHLSAQFDENGQNIELHDFENKNDTSIKRIETIINGCPEIETLLQVTKTIGYSGLLEKKDYQNAINKAGFGFFSELIGLTRLHDNLYDKSESI